MPARKIVFCIGILAIAQNEDRISIFMGHNVARALSEHGGQRMSAGLTEK